METKTVGFRFSDEIADVSVAFSGTVTIDEKPVSAEVALYLICNGLKQSVDDAGADKEKLAEGSRLRLTGLLSGKAPQGGFGRALEPIFKAARDKVADLIGLKKPATLKTWADVEAACTEHELDATKLRAWAARFVKLAEAETF